MAEPPPPGPAFIPCVWTALPYWFNMDVPSIREAVGVPPGYIWREATDGTMAGWVRPSGGEVS